MLVFVAQVSRVYPLETYVIMSYTSRHVVRASVNKQNKTKTCVLYTTIQSPHQYIISMTSLTGVMQIWSTFHREVELRLYLFLESPNFQKMPSCFFLIAKRVGRYVRLLACKYGENAKLEYKPFSRQVIAFCTKFCKYHILKLHNI